MALNMTSVRIRQRIGESELWGYVDPLYGMPEQNCPVVKDAETGLFRPFSSVATVAHAIANFAGWSNDYVGPGNTCIIQIIQHAVVEVELATPAAVAAGVTLLTPTLIGGTHVSNSIFTVSATAANCVARVIKDCGCVCVPRTCPPAAAAASDDPADSVVTHATVRSVWAEFNISYRSKT